MGQVGLTSHHARTGRTPRGFLGSLVAAALIGILPVTPAMPKAAAAVRSLLRRNSARKTVRLLCATLVVASLVVVIPQSGLASQQRPQIVDAAGDARPWGMGPGAVNIAKADILSAWFDDTPTKVMANFRVAQAPYPGDGLVFLAYVHHNGETRAQSKDLYGCVMFIAYYANAFALSTGVEHFGHFYDRCRERVLGRARVKTVELSDGSAIVSVSASREPLSFLRSGASFTRPVARSYSLQSVPFAGAAAPLDVTDVGNNHHLGPAAALPNAITSDACPRFSSVVPAAVKAPLIDVTDSATAEDPVVLTLEKGPGANFFVPYYAVHAGDNYDHFNFQVRSKREEVGLHMRLEWGKPAVDDFDLYLFGEDGDEVARATGFNFTHQELEDAVAEYVYDDGGARSGPSYEYIHGFPSDGCEGFTLEIDGHRTLGGQIVLKVWLGEVDTR